MSLILISPQLQGCHGAAQNTPYAPTHPTHCSVSRSPQLLPVSGGGWLTRGEMHLVMTVSPQEDRSILLTARRHTAFIIEVNPQLQPDPNEETAALLRVLIHKIDNTTFGGVTPVVPLWSGPPRTIIQVQAILFASLAASLLSAFLAMLGKQWLNRYVSADKRGSTVERSRDRQRKLDGIVIWYFDHVMESLPLMLQAALLLLGCALSRYLLEVNTTIASVILGATSFGVLFCLFTVAAGAASENCPYQTPGSYALRKAALIIAQVTQAIAISLGRAVGRSEIGHMPQAKVHRSEPRRSRDNVTGFLKRILRKLPGALTGLFRRVCTRSSSIHPKPVPVPDSLIMPSVPGHGRDFRCISWVLRASEDKSVHLSALKSLATMIALADFDPILVEDCFDVLVDCVKVVDGAAVVLQGLEQLAMVSATCLLHTCSHLSVMDPTSGILEDVRQRYGMAFPPDTNFRGYKFYHTLGAIHSVFHPDWNHPWLDWGDYKPSSNEHIIFAHALGKLAQSEYQRRERDKVPGWILRFALCSLSSALLPPTPVVVDCLLIIAIDLGCVVSDTGATIFDEGYVHIWQISISLTQNQATNGSGLHADIAET